MRHVLLTQHPINNVLISPVHFSPNPVQKSPNSGTPHALRPGAHPSYRSRRTDVLFETRATLTIIKQTRHFPERTQGDTQ